MPVNKTEDTRELASTGIPDLDDVLGGGFRPNRLYLVEGVPGSGKTTLSLQFLMAGAASASPCFTLRCLKAKKESERSQRSHGWSLDGITIRELVPSERALQPDEQYTMFHPSEVELSETTKTILTDVERIKPRASFSIRFPSCACWPGTALRYRRQILALKHSSRAACTVLLLDDLTATDRDLQVQSIAHGVVLLEQLNPDYGTDRRRLRVVKFRGVDFRGGFHDYLSSRGGMEVFPRLVAAEHRQHGPRTKLPSDLPALDALLGRRHRTRNEHADRRSRGHRQIDDCRPVRRPPRPHAASTRPCSFSTRADTLLTRQRFGNRPGEHVEAGNHRCSKSTRPSCRRASLCMRSASPSRDEGGDRRHRQSERLSERDARGAFLAIQLHELLIIWGSMASRRCWSVLIKG